ncbi:ribosome small subunit-dependent GTPase A [Desulfopila sp. IMCC35008]|uniref:ribosome small subunit-dependent GTPase A n=1 Tax=Desulfopila sp. IMCC35008 TaxID=2653858 RepID=UPI0013D114EC|nr:ribosome small subunit-dependent GTPase A [Desulfopila sp. IMCC35008]
MKGKIIKGVSGFYYVHIPGKGVYECRARGILRKEKIKPLIGDNVEMALVDEAQKVGNVERILQRTNHLIRPAVANLDQTVIVFSLDQPEPNFNLLDSFLVMIEAKGVDIIICFNKSDLIPSSQVDAIAHKYKQIGYSVVSTSTTQGHGIADLKTVLYGKTSVFAGPSGVGKSSILNLIQDEMILRTAEVSEKIGRGKHTTRHVQLICFHDNSYVVDTPGFSSLTIEDMQADQLKYHFREFYTYEPQCKYIGCNHLNEPQCGVKVAVANGDIAESRYLSYTQLFEELTSGRR